MRLSDLNPNDIEIESGEEKNEDSGSIKLSEIDTNDIQIEDSSEEISKLESMGIGAVQGLTWDTGDEIAGFIGAAAQYMTQDEQKEFWDLYRSNRDKVRARIKQNIEQNPVTYYTSDVVAGIIPAILSGGTTAAASMGKTLGKAALKEGAEQVGKRVGKETIKESAERLAKTGASEAAEKTLGQASLDLAKTGALTGMGVGLGASEADLTKGEVGQAALDTAIGGATGAVLAPALPVAAKTAKKGWDTTKKVAEFVTPQSEYIKAAYKYGTQGKKIDEKVIKQDIISTASKILRRIDSVKAESNLKDLEKQLTDEYGVTVDLKNAFNETVEDLTKISQDDFFDLGDSKVLDQIKKVTGDKIKESEEALLAQAKQTSDIEAIKQSNKEKEAIIAAEKDIAKTKEQANAEVIDQDELVSRVDDMPGSVLTEDGQLLGKQATFETADGEKFTTKNLRDASPYTPTEPKIERLDNGLPIAVTEDLSSGKLKVIVGKVEDIFSRDIENMSINDAENIRRQLNQLIKESVNSGKDRSDAVLERAKVLAVEIKDIVDNAIAKSDVGTELMDKRKRFSNIMTAEELLGIKKKMSQRRDVNKELRSFRLGNKFAYKKNFEDEAKTGLATKMLGPNILDEKSMNQFELLRKINKIMGRESEENLSKAGLYRQFVGDLPNLIGRAKNKVASSKPVQVANRVVNLPDTTLSKVKDRLLQEDSMVLQGLGTKLEKALQSTKKDQLLYSLGQVPAFRKYVRDVTSDYSDDLMDASGFGNSEQPMELDPINAPLYEDSDSSFLETEGQQLSQQLDRISPSAEGDQNDLLESTSEPSGDYLEDLNVSKTLGDETSADRSPSGYDSEFFSTQDGVELDGVDPDLLEGLKSVAKKIGLDSLEISSGVRGPEKTEALFYKNLKGVGVNKNNGERYPYDFRPFMKDPKLAEAIKEVVVDKERKYTSLGKAQNAIREMVGDPELAKKINQSIQGVRWDYAGFRSSHMDGKKVDIPKSSFIRKFGKEQGPKKYIEFEKALREEVTSNGERYNILNEEGKGVLDIRGPESFYTDDDSEPEAEKVQGLSEEEVKSAQLSDFQKNVMPDLTERAKETPLDQELAGYASQKPLDLELSQYASQTPQDLVDYTDISSAIESLERNIVREKMDLASGGQGQERVTLDDLMGDIFNLPVDEDMQNQMLDAAFEGNMAELERLLGEVKQGM